MRGFNVYEQIMREKLRIILASSIGTMLEWYDFSLFIYLTPVLSALFFPKDNPLVSLMLTYAIFSISYFIRPLGAIIFGHFGDKLGRKRTLTFSILLMSIPTFLIGLLPGYQDIGIAAPLLLILLRVLQGLSAGGESTGASLFVLESIYSKDYRGLLASILWAVVGIGMLLGSFSATLIIQSNIVWAWRIPFLLGLITGLIGYFLRKLTLESEVFRKAFEMKTRFKYPLIEALKHYKKAFCIMLGLYALSAMISYLVLVFMPHYASHIIGLPLKETSLVSTLALLSTTILVPVGGYLSDKTSRKECLFIFALGFVILSYPLFKIITLGKMIYFIFAECIFAILASGFQGAISGAVFEMVPTPIRFSTIAVTYNLSYAIFGGTAPFIASYLVSITGNKTAPGIYLTLGAVLACIAALNIRRIDNDSN